MACASLMACASRASPAEAGALGFFPRWRLDDLLALTWGRVDRERWTLHFTRSTEALARVVRRFSDSGH